MNIPNDSSDSNLVLVYQKESEGTLERKNLEKKVFISPLSQQTGVGARHARKKGREGKMGNRKNGNKTSAVLGLRPRHRG